jgi:hypothetical protein
MGNSALDLVFPSVDSKEVVARFDGGDITSDAGLLLISNADRKLGLTRLIAEAIDDHRDQDQVEHKMIELVRERVYAISAGYEDANDLSTLRSDPALKTVCDRLPASGEKLASQPTISRLENAVGRKDLVRIGMCIAESVVSGLPKDTRQVIIDVDPSDDPCHGQQEFEFFNGYYDEHCYLPIFVHITGDDGRQRLLCSLLRPGNAGATTGLIGVLCRTVKLLRRELPEVRIILRGDCAFGTRAVIDFCEKTGIDFILGLTGNSRLHTLSTPVQMDACLKYGWEGNGCREYGEFRYKAGPWKRHQRVVIKAEITRGKLNPRFVVTSITDKTAEEIYEFYCGRGEQENRIKEMKLDLGSGRTSCHRFLANQFRLLLHTAACVLMGVLQQCLDGTKWARAQVGTIRLRLLKVGARIVETCRKVWVHLPTAFPEKEIWSYLHMRLWG